MEHSTNFSRIVKIKCTAKEVAAVIYRVNSEFLNAKSILKNVLLLMYYLPLAVFITILFTKYVANCDGYEDFSFLTLFLARLLHEWLSRPVRDLTILQSRQEAISELLHSESPVVHQLQELLDGIPDIDRGLTTCIHQRVC